MTWNTPNYGAGLDHCFFAIQRLDDQSGEASGRVGLWGIDSFARAAHIGGQGIGRDAVEMICRYGFVRRGLERLQVDPLEVNAAVRATALAGGSIEEGRRRAAARYLGRRADEMVYGQLPTNGETAKPDALDLLLGERVGPICSPHRATCPMRGMIGCHRGIDD